MDKYKSFAELQAAERLGKDFVIELRRQQSAQVVILAPHGGRIEPQTAELAARIAGEEFSLYCFKGKKKKGRNCDLHITSHNFDEPQCLELIGKHERVVAIHGCDLEGECVLLGGRDRELVGALAEALCSVGIGVKTSGHAYPGNCAKNICNRGATGAGVQFELSMAFRKGARVAAFVGAIRGVLLKY